MPRFPAADLGTQGNAVPADANDGIEDEDETFQDDPTMDGQFDKANWCEENTSVFCDICLDQMTAGNVSNGFMTNRGYNNIAEEYYLKVGLRHSRKQLRNRWDQLKRLYGFWLWLNKQTGNGTVWHDNQFWKDTCKKLRKGPPKCLDQFEQMFCNVAVDGSSSCIPGEEDFGIDQDDEDDGQDGSPMSISTRKRASSTVTTATSPVKKTKSPMVRVMKELTESMKADSASTQKVLNGDLMAKSMKKCQPCSAGTQAG